jgi:multidrug efflux system membrane fusion protein
MVGVKSVTSAGIVKFNPIQLVADTPEGMWLGGLPDHVTIISRGQEFVKVGQKVDPVPAGTTAISELKGK